MQLSALPAVSGLDFLMDRSQVTPKVAGFIELPGESLTGHWHIPALVHGCEWVKVWSCSPLAAARAGATAAFLHEHTNEAKGNVHQIILLTTTTAFNCCLKMQKKGMETCRLRLTRTKSLAL